LSWLDWGREGEGDTSISIKDCHSDHYGTSFRGLGLVRNSVQEFRYPLFYCIGWRQKHGK
jgi:hypothetical protein